MERALSQETQQFVEAQHAQAQLVAPIIEWPVHPDVLVMCPQGQLVGGKVFHHFLPQFEATFNDGFAVPSFIKSTQNQNLIKFYIKLYIRDLLMLLRLIK